MTTIKYENPKKNPNRAAKLKEYLDLLASRNDLIADKSSYEALFYVGKSCYYYQENELAMFLEKNVAQILTKTLKSLFEKRGELNFNSEKSIETGSKPNASIDVKDIKESIFSYIIYSINILSKDLVRFEKKSFIKLNFHKTKLN